MIIMDTWKDSKEYKEIYSRCEELDLINKKTNFSCYTDFCFEFEIEQGDKRFCFSYVGEEAVVHDAEVKWLLGFNRVLYFSFSEYIMDGYYEDGESKWVRLNTTHYKPNK